MRNSRKVAATVAIILTVALNFGLRAQTEALPDPLAELKLVPPKSVPATGTFYSLQNADWPPLPCDPFPDLPVYWLGDGVFLMDDSSVDYVSLQEQAAFQSAETSQANGAQFAGTGVGAGCGLWLTISATGSNAVLLTLHNTRSNQTYTVRSIENLSLTNWIVETNLTGASGDFTETLIAMGQRSNLFFRASEFRDYMVITNASFQGLTGQDLLQEPPDTMGAVGPNHFVELLNGLIAVYDKSGNLIAQTNTLGFFALHDTDGTNYPTGVAMVDPRILYDHQSQRWVACAIDPLSVGTNQASLQAILAVSNSDSPTNLAAGWTRYLVRVRREGLDTDFTTLGLDANGIYLSVLHRASGTLIGHTIVAIKKPDIYQGTNIANRLDITNGLPVWTIQPAVNFDDVPTNGYAWFVAKGPPDLGTNYQGGALLYRRLQWQGTNAVWDTNWFAVSNTGTNYQDYYDLDGTNVLIAPSAGVSAPQLGTTNRINLYTIGSRLMMAVVRNGFLWTCQTVGLNGTNGVYVGNSSGTNVNRSAVQWLKLSVDPAGGPLSYSTHGRIYDKAATNAYYYYFPSLMVNCAGDMVIGFSGSSATNYVGAFYTWRFADGPTLGQPRLIQPGSASYNFARWGDYSATTLDPTDDWSFWTVQQYADSTSAFYPWGTWIAKIKPNP